jgi:hypothetical protein
LTLPEKSPQREFHSSSSEQIQVQPQNREHVQAEPNFQTPIPTQEHESKGAGIAPWAFGYAMFATLGLLVPDTPHVGDPGRPARWLFWYGIFLVPGFWMAMVGIRRQGQTIAWIALWILSGLLLLVLALLLSFINKPW